MPLSMAISWPNRFRITPESTVVKYESGAPRIDRSSCSWNPPAVTGTTNMNIHQKKNAKLAQAPRASTKYTPTYMDSRRGKSSVHHSTHIRWNLVENARAMTAASRTPIRSAPTGRK